MRPHWQDGKGRVGAAAAREEVVKGKVIAQIDDFHTAVACAAFFLRIAGYRQCFTCALVIDLGALEPCFGKNFCDSLGALFGQAGVGSGRAGIVGVAHQQDTHLLVALSLRFWGAALNRLQVGLRNGFKCFAPTLGELGGAHLKLRFILHRDAQALFGLFVTFCQLDIVDLHLQLVLLRELGQFAASLVNILTDQCTKQSAYTCTNDGAGGIVANGNPSRRTQQTTSGDTDIAGIVGAWITAGEGFFQCISAPCSVWQPVMVSRVAAAAVRVKFRWI